MHNMRLLPNDHDLMQLTLDDIRSLQTRLQQDISKLSNVNIIFHRFEYLIAFSLDRTSEIESDSTTISSSY